MQFARQAQQPDITHLNFGSDTKQDELFLRGTLKYNPSDKLSIRIKGTFTNTKFIGGPSYFSDIVSCPYGTPQRPSEDPGNCLNDGVGYTSRLSNAFLALNPLLENANGSRNNRQILLSSSIDYKVNDVLKLTSVTGYYDVKERLTSNGGYGPVSNNGFAVRYRNRQFSEELRLASDFGGQLDFLLGGFFENRSLYTKTYIGNPTTLAQFPLEWTRQNQKSYSLFGQMIFRPTEQVELTAGGRWTHETKRLLEYNVATFNAAANGFNAPVDVTKLAAYPGSPNPRLQFNNFSPEVTLTYKPQNNLMVFASFKKGFKSGGFDAGYTAGAILGNPLRDQTFDPEKVTGVELGLKSELADRQIMLNLVGYWYDYKDLQVSTFDTIARAYTTQNAAKARIQGVELETQYRPNSVPGLNLHASLAYNNAKFGAYQADCFAGQTAALGCNQTFVASPNQATPPATAFQLNGVFGQYTTQNLTGRRLRKAPEFSANFGGYYEFPMWDGVMFSMSTDVAYSSAYNYGVTYQYFANQRAFAKLDATLRMFADNKSWEIAMIGRNLTNKRNLVNGIDRTGTGGAKGSTQPTCAAIGQTGCQFLPDLIGTAALPRTFAVQLTYKY